MKFYVSSGIDGRVILDTELHGEIHQEIEAGSWLQARKEVDISKFGQDPFSPKSYFYFE